ncbi:hypothetical protein LJR039_007546 [Pseudorhodoferax sp. LjRoot39]|uniref:hypothetical protein n=1 Tax=Pseudorhodoferax sp. LjRoot39 TaxID=3342328 RepID=UPI003ED08CDA
MLSTLPLELRLRGKSTTLSHRAPIYYVDLTVRSGSSLIDALNTAHAEDVGRKAAGFYQAALDQAARAGMAAGAFEESTEDGASVVEEFFPDDHEQEGPGSTGSSTTKLSLAEKLDRKARRG